MVISMKRYDYYDEQWEYQHKAPAQALSRFVDMLYDLRLDDCVLEEWDTTFTGRTGATWKELNRALIAMEWVT